MIVCSQCGRESPDEERFCASCGTALAPVARREERKVVTVVFADLVGSTARAERLDPEDVRALLSSYHARVRRELEAHGGTVEKFIGDAVVAVFGAPLAHEDDPERAVRSALAIQEAIDELNEAEPALELEVRIGVNTGEALVALEARPEAGEGMVSGDVINTAARLQAAAPPGGILVGEHTHRATERAVDYAESPPIEAKGKAAPVIAWRALRRRASFGVEQGAVVRAPLVGRDREVALLSDALARVRSDERPQLITLVGVPGIGKSRLVHELWEIVDADPDLITWRRGRSLPYGEGVAYWALGEIVKAQAGILESDGADVAAEKLARAVSDLLPEHSEAAWVERQLRPLVGLPSADGGQPSRDEAFAARSRLLEALAEQRPAVLIFEDLHWADDDLLDFVDELTERLGTVPLLLVCTARPELLTRRPGWGGGKPNALTLSLAPLSDDDTARLLQALLDRSVLPAETQAALIQRAEGVPLFAEEYARMLESDDSGSELPENLQAIVVARIDGLPSADKEVLQDAAVLGKVFWTDALATLTGADPSTLEDCLRRLERQEFVRRERRSAVEGARQYVFLHALVRDAAYGQIPRAGRSVKHRRAAEWIAALPADRAEDRAEMLAHHLESAISYGEAAGALVDDLRPFAVAALRDAGERAWGLSLVTRAIQLYERALAMTQGAAPDPELLLLHAEATSWGMGIESDPAPLLRRAIDALLASGRRELAAIAMVTLERRLWRVGEADPLLLDRALELVADVGPTPERGRVLALVAGRRAITSNASAETLQLAAEAVEIARAHGDRAAETEALNNLALGHSNGGDIGAALEVGRRALELALECGSSDVVRCYNNLATYEFHAGELDTAVRHHHEGLELARRVGHKALAQHLEAEIVLDAFMAGDWHELEAGFGLWRARAEAGTPHLMDTQLQMAELTVALCREGHLDVGELERVLDAVLRVGDKQSVLPAVGDAADLLTTAGVAGAANRLLDEYQELARTSTYPAGSWSVAAALAWVQLRDDPMPSEMGGTAELPWKSAVDLLRRGDAAAAADVLAGIGARASEAPVRHHAAQALTRVDPAEAERQLELACAFWRSVGATARLTDAEQLRAQLRSAAS